MWPPKSHVFLHMLGPCWLPFQEQTLDHTSWPWTHPNSHGQAPPTCTPSSGAPRWGLCAPCQLDSPPPSAPLLVACPWSKLLPLPRTGLLTHGPYQQWQRHWELVRQAHSWAHLQLLNRNLLVLGGVCPGMCLKLSR